jgi:hypothetical protein
LRRIASIEEVLAMVEPVWWNWKGREKEGRGRQIVE